MFELQASKKVIEHEDLYEDDFQEHYPIQFPSPYNSPFSYSEMENLEKFLLGQYGKHLVSLEIHGKLSLPLNEPDCILE